MKSPRVFLVAAASAALLISATVVGITTGDDSAPRPIATTGAATHSHLGDGDPQPGASVGAGLLPRLVGGGASQAGCTTRLISANFSARSTSPSMFVLHYTVSPNRTGTSDVDGIRNFFNNSANEVSSHYVIDWEGHCLLIVPESQKAWTQGAFNSNAISIEFIATGSESRESWAKNGAAGLKKGAKVVADSLRRNHIPFRYVNPSGCTPTAGITDHNQLECGNDHHDVSPNFPWKKFKGYLAAEMAPPKRCAKLQLTNKGKVLKQSGTFKPTEYRASLARFQKAHRPRMSDILKKGDGSYGIKRVKVVC